MGTFGRLLHNINVTGINLHDLNFSVIIRT
jgi:hypothetical protein